MPSTVEERIAILETELHSSVRRELTDLQNKVNELHSCTDSLQELLRKLEAGQDNIRASIERKSSLWVEMLRGVVTVVVALIGLIGTLWIGWAQGRPAMEKAVNISVQHAVVEALKQAERDSK